MIFDSWVWKKELRKELTAFNRFIAKTDFTAESIDDDHINLKLEKFYFVLSFIVRKLHESNKLSDELIATNITVIKFERINKSKFLDFLTGYGSLEEYYNFDNGIKSSLPVLTLCNDAITKVV
jgi:hypothetical protein